MTAPKKLRAVAPDERPPEPPRVLSLSEAVESGDYRQILIAQRREIALSIPDERGPAKAALHRQLSLIAKELQALEAAAEQEALENAKPAEDEKWDSEAI